ncbi:BTAD domain-containing putative transcriptional regulator [Candidatus Bipolaricaulota bacterium]
MTSVLRLFGAPVLLGDDAPVQMHRRKAIALLSYLGTTRSIHQRESLATILWPESGSKSAHAALRNVLWMLRTTPIRGLIVSNRTSVQLLEDDSLIVDVNRFRDLTKACSSGEHSLGQVCAACRQEISEAVELFREPFMHGYVVANSVLFEDWQLAEGESLKRELTETLERLIDYFMSREEWPSATKYARRWLDMDALNESAVRKLISALAGQGKRREALQVFEECSQRLLSEIGLAPDSTTVELVHSLRARSPRMLIPANRQPSRLPAMTNPLVGRRRDLEALERQLLDAKGKAFCLVGMGGVGKTSLALHVGRRIDKHVVSGVTFVSLDTLPDDVRVAAAVGNAMKLQLPGESLSETEMNLASSLLDHDRLIILDGAEDRLSEVISLVTALQIVPQVRVLITSRIPVRSSFVTAIALEGLECPDSHAPAGLQEKAPAVQFLRVVAERHGNAALADEDEIKGMARLARLLQGSPLGLEIAAGWRSTLSWDDIADRVSENVEFLVNQGHEIGPRHRTLAAVFEQSWCALPGHAKQTLRRLSIFHNGFTIRAAEQVTGCDPASLAVLVNRHFVRRIGSKRFTMHELLRRFARRKLLDSDANISHLDQKHADYFATDIACLYQSMKGPEQFAAVSSLENDLENVRAALLYAAAEGLSEHLRKLVTGLVLYYFMRTLLTDAEAALGNALRLYKRNSERDSDIEGFLQIAVGWFTSWTRSDEAARRVEAGLRLLPEDGPLNELQAMAFLFHAYACFGKERQANRHRTNLCLAYFRERGDNWGEAFALDAEAFVEQYHDRVAAEKLVRRSLLLRRKSGDSCGEGLMVFRLARLEELRGDLELALVHYREAHKLSARYVRNTFGIISSILAQARVCGGLGEIDESRQLAERALQLSRRSGYRFQIGRSLLEAARATHASGESRLAVTYLEEAFSVLTQGRWADLQTACARMLVALAQEREDERAAKRWLQEIEMLSSAGQSPLISC